jgi:serpin B
MFPPPPVQVPTPPTVTPSNFFVENPADDLTLAIANAIWIQQGFPVEETYLDSIAMNYGGGVNGVDFSQNSEDAYRTINQWIEQATNGHINDMPPRESISSATRLALTNAVYFRGEWTFPFSESQTYESIFNTQDGNEVSIPMMVNDFAVAECVRGTDYHAVQLPYGRSRNAAMLILLPDSGVFHQVENRLDAEFVVNVMSELQLTNTLTYSMPRFEFESEIDLQSSLSAMGMTAPFGAGANFSGVSANELAVDYVGHKATISVDEQGTEASGATSVATAILGLPRPCGAEVTADRPFIFAIYDTRRRTILFLGRVMNPAA